MRVGGRFVVRAMAALCAALAVSVGCSSSGNPGQGGPPPNDGGDSRAFGPLGDRADLPVDQRPNLANLSAPVDVVRDTFGRPHIFAATLPDAVRAEGYVIARDRATQLEILRRTAEGRMAELFGDISPGTIDGDITFRQLGLTRIAQAQNAAIAPGDLRDVLDAYADGITQAFRAIRAGTAPLPAAWQSIPAAAYTDWSAVDSLAVARLQAWLLSYNADLDIDNQTLFDQLRTTFNASSSDPDLKRRAGLERDLWWFAPLDPIAQKPDSAARKALAPGLRATSMRAAPDQAAQKTRSAAAAQAKAALDALDAVRQKWASAGFGSNAWAIAPALSANGHALLASDPHLDMDSPSQLWPVSLTVAPNTPGALRLSGAALPGIPGIILGHNGKVAWGATVVGYDVSDAYQETISSDGQGVAFNHATVPLQNVDEIIGVHGQASFTYHVKIVPHHGPIFPNIVNHRVVDPVAGPALSSRWTGSDPTLEVGAILALARAGNTDDAMAALGSYATGAQNWVFADTSGNIAWTSAAHVPIRAPGALTWDRVHDTGTLPCFPLPGDGSAEWTGNVPAQFVPSDKNPASSYIISANNDPTGDLDDGDPTDATLPDGSPVYWGCGFDVGYRASRIRQRITAPGHPLAVDDLAPIQADVRSQLGSRLVPVLLAAIDRAQQERATPGSHPDLATVVHDAAYDGARIDGVRGQLAAWGSEADYLAASGIDPATGQPLSDTGTGPDAVAGRASKATLLFNLWLRNFVIRTMRDEVAKANGNVGHIIPLKTIMHLVFDDPKTLATYDASTGDSILWDDLATPGVIESRDDRAVRALLDSLTWLDKNVGSDAKAARWGAHHTVTMLSLLAPLGPSIPPSGDPLFPNGLPRGGDEFCVDAAEFSLATVLPDPDFTYGVGPAQRFVIDLDPSGPHAWNAFPGGNVSDPTSPHFRDELEYWRENRTHAVPFTVDEVVAAKESRAVYVPAK